MIALIQRVRQASVTVDGNIVGRIDQGILALIGVERHDDTPNLIRLAERLTAYRIFQDADDKMNLSVKDMDGGLLLVPQFTLAADTRKGNRPGFSTAAEPAVARQLFDKLVNQLRLQHSRVETGQFGANMLVALENDGPVTFWLQA